MSTKSKTAMEATEGEVRANTRPVRNVKPVSYKEVTTTKRGTASGQSVKESESEPKDKKKKKVNGNSNDKPPTKKATKKKAEANDEETSEQEIEDELMVESRKPQDESKSVADKATGAAKKTQSRKKKTEESAMTDAMDEVPVDDSASNKGSESKAQKDSKTGRRKGKDVVEETNGESSSKPPAESKVVAPKATASKASKAKKPPSVEVNSDSQDEASAPSVASKPVSSKTAKDKKSTKESNDAVDENEVAIPKGKTAKAKKAVKESNDAVVENKVPSKSTKGKKVAKESIEEEDEIEEVDAPSKTSKSRSKKTVPKDPPRGTKRKSPEPIPNVIKPKLKKPLSTASKLQIPIVTSLDLESPASEWNFKITTWNVAGLRAMIEKDGMKFLKNENPDMFCLQETKCMEGEVPPEANVDGYHKFWNGIKGGKAGVALYSKKLPYDVTYGINGVNDPNMDEEARLITAEYTKFYLLCVYVPNSGRKLVNLDKRLDWDKKFQSYLMELNEKKPVIICGDMNVAHLEIDLANPKTNKRNAGFTQEERDSFTNLLSRGFVDTYRELYPDKIQSYTFWTYMASARAKNVGWRLDYFIVSERLKNNVVDNLIRSSILGSDHCPVTLFLKL